MAPEAKTDSNVVNNLFNMFLLSINQLNEEMK